MLPLKRLFFVTSGLLMFAILLCLTLIETLPFYIYYIISGKYLGLSIKAQDITFEYFEKKINETDKPNSSM
jgi:hypothetical protein